MHSSEQQGAAAVDEVIGPTEQGYPALAKLSSHQPLVLRYVSLIL